MKRHTVAAVIPTKNVAEFIRGTLESLRFCDEVIIVDMSSTDATREICESYPNVRFFDRQDYIYGNYNFGADAANTEWIIRLDSDERLSPELQDEIIALLSSEPACDVYTAPFTSYIDGVPIEHGMSWEQPRRKTLYRKGALRYMVRSEHEDLTPTNPEAPLRTGQLKHGYHHFSTPSLSVFLRKIDYYTEKDFERASKDEVRVMNRWRLIIAAFKRFFRQYVRQRGYRDGYPGFILCVMNMIYLLVHEMKAWEFANDMKSNHVRSRDAYDRVLIAHNESRQTSEVSTTSP